MGFGCAKEDTGATLALFSEVIRSPALAQPKVDLYKAQARVLKAVVLYHCVMLLPICVTQLLVVSARSVTLVLATIRQGSWMVPDAAQQ